MSNCAANDLLLFAYFLIGFCVGAAAFVLWATFLAIRADGVGGKDDE